jgi:hypothetical protein
MHTYTYFKIEGTKLDSFMNWFASRGFENKNVELLYSFSNLFG